MSQQILNEAIIFTSNHEINKDYSKNKHNTLSKEEVLQMFYEDKIEILYKYIGIIFNSISDNYNNYPDRVGIAKFLDDYLERKNIEFEYLKNKKASELMKEIESDKRLNEYHSRFIKML